MEHRAATQIVVQTEISIPAATIQLAHFDSDGPADITLHTDNTYWLDLSLTPRPRNARMCYRELWSPHRFERLGKIFMVPPGHAVHARTDAGSSQTSLVCHLKPEAFQTWLAEGPKWTDHQLEKILDLRDANVLLLLRRLAEEISQPGFASEMLVELMVGQLAIELARHHQTVNESHFAGGLAPWRLRRIDERLREVGPPPTLAELAKMCQLSTRQLTRGFRVSRDCSIGDYVANSRIEQAKLLLLADESTKAIAYLLGFGSPSSFCCAFRRAAGVTPREYRQRVPRDTH